MKETSTLALESIEAMRGKVEHELAKDKGISELANNNYDRSSQPA